MQTLSIVILSEAKDLARNQEIFARSLAFARDDSDRDDGFLQGFWHKARFVITCAAGNDCNPTRVGYRPAHHFMKKIGVILLTGFSIFLAPIVRAQSEDPSEVFLKAYMTSQQGEKLEHENNFRDALAKFRFAGSLLDELRKRHAEWQPAIVEYRSRKIGESILRVEQKVGTQKDLNATAGANPALPVLPQKTGFDGAECKFATAASSHKTIPPQSFLHRVTLRFRKPPKSCAVAWTNWKRNCKNRAAI